MRARRLAVGLVVAVAPGILPAAAAPASSPACAARAGAAIPPPISGPCGGIRPGALMVFPAGCTMNFVFTSTGSDRYIGTAAHCVGGVGQPVSLGDAGTIGTVAYWGFGDPNGTDFAMVKVSSAKLGLVNPALCHWGGPTSLAVGFQDEPVIVDHYGNGIGTGTLTATKARRGVAYAWSDSTFTLASSGTFGDSGSPIMSIDGKALGVLIQISAFGNVATRLDVALERATAQLGIGFTLLGAPLA